MSECFLSVLFVYIIPGIKQEVDKKHLRFSEEMK